MRKNRELMPKDLKASCNPDMFKIATTKEIDDYSDLVYGQERGIKALNFGIDIDLNGYNMYLEGSAGVGKTMYTHRVHQMIGYMFTILIIQMNQLQFHLLLVKVLFSRNKWKTLLRTSEKSLRKHLIIKILIKKRK